MGMGLCSSLITRGVSVRAVMSIQSVPSDLDLGRVGEGVAALGEARHRERAGARSPRGWEPYARCRRLRWTATNPSGGTPGGPPQIQMLITIVATASLSMAWTIALAVRNAWSSASPPIHVLDEFFAVSI